MDLRQHGGRLRLGHPAQQAVGLSLVVEDARTVAPAPGREEERGDEVLLAIGSWIEVVGRVGRRVETFPVKYPGDLQTPAACASWRTSTACRRCPCDPFSATIMP